MSPNLFLQEFHWRTWNLVWRWMVVTMGLTAIFWGIWYWINGSVPFSDFGQMVPLYDHLLTQTWLSRWLDVPAVGLTTGMNIVLWRNLSASVIVRDRRGEHGGEFTLVTMNLSPVLICTACVMFGLIIPLGPAVLLPVGALVSIIIVLLFAIGNKIRALASLQRNPVRIIRDWLAGY